MNLQAFVADVISFDTFFAARHCVTQLRFSCSESVFAL